MDSIFDFVVKTLNGISDDLVIVLHYLVELGETHGSVGSLLVHLLGESLKHHVLVLNLGLHRVQNKFVQRILFHLVDLHLFKNSDFFQKIILIETLMLDVFDFGLHLFYLGTEVSYSLDGHIRFFKGFFEIG